MTWRSHAERLAEEVTHSVSRWREPVAALPRHLFVPRWWDRSVEGWTLRDGPSEEEAWLRAAYADVTLVTRVGGMHADNARDDDRPDGRPTSSSTMPSLVVRMYQHARVYDGADALDVGVGSGYGCALLAKRLGDTHVSSIDVDAYLAEVAARRLERVGLHPRIATCDATGPLPGTYDRIVSMVSVRPIPPGWLQALRPGGRLVTTVANTLMVVTADKVDGRNIGMICGEQLLAVGRVERDCAGFMETRSGQDYPPGLVGMFAAVRDQRGEQVTRGPYPVIDVDGCGELDSVLEVLAPGIEHRYEEADDGTRTAWMLHADGSWARASARGDEPPLVHQSGPRHLWDLFDEIRHYWLTHGYLQLYGARAFITASGTIHLARGDWQATIS